MINEESGFFISGRDYWHLSFDKPAELPCIPPIIIHHHGIGEITHNHGRLINFFNPKKDLPFFDWRTFGGISIATPPSFVIAPIYIPPFCVTKVNWEIYKAVFGKRLNKRTSKK